jgi:hypothetical protein
VGKEIITLHVIEHEESQKRRTLPEGRVEVKERVTGYSCHICSIKCMREAVIRITNL